jgi:hypothetical protein
MCRLLVLFTVLVFPTFAYAGGTTCNLALAKSLKNTVISFERVLDKRERTGKSRGGLGSAWFLSSTHLVTINHVVTAQKLTKQWKEVTLRWGDEVGQMWKHELKTQARIVKVVRTGMIEPIVIVEIEDAIPWAQVPKIRKKPLANNERVIGLGFKGGTLLKFGIGRVVATTTKEIRLEMTDGKTRMKFTSGTSGCPFFDCAGQVVAMLSEKRGGLFGRTNNVAVSASALLHSKWK